MHQPTRMLPALDRPSRSLFLAGLFCLLLIDAVLLVTLQHAPVLLGALFAGIGGVLLALHLPASVALLGVGTPLLDPVVLIAGRDDAVFFGVRALLGLAFVLYAFLRVERVRRLTAAVVRDPVVLFAGGIGLALLLGMLWTPSPVYGRMKLIGYFSTNFPLVIGGYLIAFLLDGEEPGARKRRFDQLLGAVLVIALIMAITALINQQGRFYYFTDRLTVFRLNPIWVARTMGLALVCLLGLWTLRRVRLSWIFLIALPLFVVLVLTGSRGPLAAVYFTLVVWVIARQRISLSRGVLFALMTVGAAVALLLIMPDAIRERFVSPFTGDVSGMFRIGLLQVVRDVLVRIPPLGVGTGGFGHLVGVGDLRFYPHNIFAEIGIETGILGTLCLVGFLLSAARAGLLAWREPRCRVAFFAFLYALLNAQVSGDIYVNEWVWLFAGVLAGWRH